MKENREYKSDVFSMLMEDKANALEVYNALNGSDYTDPEDVELVHLEKGVSLSIRNDASYIIDMNFSFYEHQSTYNRNMPLRSMIYFVNALDDWLKENEHDLFGRKRIMIPTPHFVVFYNGIEKRPESGTEAKTGNPAAGYEAKQQGIYISVAPNPRAELEETVRLIHRMVREDGMRYQDFAVLTGDLSVYGTYAREIFEKCGVPYFVDEKHSVLMNPFVEFLRAAIEMVVQSFSYESVFRYPVSYTHLTLPTIA